ncbi:AEC family transporter [Herbaspirillum robiniae]|uniref:AEC family transporter n=1 Tax=Herbaspirillum robiniae TaxID=2014887 RepID=A0ABX2LYE5_9BURK|nr:AEC family transporter [Herbaspirillum robiniae]NUU03120.1 AEC family transporter [Herbaspirillum robiniae]
MELIQRIASIILPVFAIIGMGYGYARWRGEVVRMDMASVNRVSMEALAPLMIFSALSSKSFDLYHNAWLILASVLISLGSGLLAWPVARALGYDRRTFLPPMMYNNGGNMGLPLLLLAFGQDALPAAVALFTASTFVYFSLCVKMIQSGREQRPGSLLRLLSSPIMLAMILGVLFAVFRIGVPGPLFSAMKLLGEASIPIMLFSLGVRMMDISFRSWHIGLVGAAVCPLAGLLCALLLDQLLPLTAVQRGEMYLFAALPPAVLCFMVAEQYRQEPDKVAAIVLMGNLAAIVFVPFGLWLGLPEH